MMLDLVRKHQIQVFDHGIHHTAAHGYSVDAIAETADIERLRNLGYHLQQHEDVDERGKAGSRRSAAAIVTRIHACAEHPRLEDLVCPT